MVDPALDGEDIPPELRDHELAAPAVVAERVHGRLCPAGSALVAVAEDGGQGVVPVREDVGFDGHQLAGRPLGGELATLDLGRGGLDNHPPPPFDGQLRRGRAPARRTFAAPRQGCSGHE